VTTTEPKRIYVPGPGVYDDITDVQYHADPVRGGSLSHSGMKTLMTRCPAKFRADIDHGRKSKREFEVGKAAHAEVIGTGAEVVVIDGNRNRKDIKAAVAEAEAAGLVVITSDDAETIGGMARALRAHPKAGELFVPGRGHAERVVVWFDEEFGVYRRAMYDWSMVLPDGRFAIVDYKSCRDGGAHPVQVSKALWNFRYFTQDRFYSHGAEAVGLGEDIAFLFVFQEKEYPYLVTVAEVEPEARAWGDLVVRRGVELYATCKRDNHWPPYAEDIIRVGLPRYADRELTDQWQRGELTFGEDYDA
jgi:hypothetical protein